MTEVKAKTKGIKRRTGNVSIGDFSLESGIVLQDVHLAYEQVGPDGAPVVLVCHALTGNQFAAGTNDHPGWWAGLIGAGKSIDTNKFQVITFNVLGGCNGSTGPLSKNPRTGTLYRNEFPHVTVRDMVRAQERALKCLGIRDLKAVIGGSLGGMQVLEWGLCFPSQMEILFVLAATPFLSDYGIAFNRIGIEVIEKDPGFKGGHYGDSREVKGFEIARMTGMVTYRSADLFADRFTRSQCRKEENGKPLYEVESYLKYQGEKITERFDVNSYLTLLYAMNDHDIGRSRGGWKNALNQFQADMIGVGYKGDLIYPPDFMKEFIEKVPSGKFYEVDTKYGHDGFLVEFEKWSHIIQHHLNQ